MKLKTKKLTEFLNKSLMGGRQEIQECILDFDKDGLKINANSPSQQARVMAWLKSSAFEEYENIGKVGLNDMGNVVRVLDRFGEKIIIKKEGNLLTVSGEGKKVDIELVSETFLSTDTGEPSLEFDETFVIPSLKLKEVFKDVQMNKDAEIILTTEEKKVIFSNTGKYKFKNFVQTDTCKGGVSVKFGEPFVNALSNLNGQLEFSVKSDFPCKVRETTETSVISIIVAPRTEESQ